MELTKIALNIKKLRELKNYTQEFMANHLEMSQAGYSKLENGETDLTLSKIDAISKVLDTSVSNILNFDEKLVFHQYSNQSTNQNAYVVNVENFERERKLYEAQIDTLKVQNQQLSEQVSFLQKLIEK